jgi:hypothetical protein
LPCLSVYDRDPAEDGSRSSCFFGQGLDSTGAVDAKTGGWDATSSSGGRGRGYVCASTSGREIPASPPLTKCEFKPFSNPPQPINQPHRRNERISSFRIPHTDCCATVQSRTLDRHTHLGLEQRIEGSKLLLAAAATPNQDRTPTFVLSTRPCLPVAVINISSRPQFQHSPPFFRRKASIASALPRYPVLSHITSRARDSRSRIIHDSIVRRRSVGRSLAGEDQIRFTNQLVGGSGDRRRTKQPSKASVKSRTLHRVHSTPHLEGLNTFTPVLYSDYWQTHISSPRPILPQLASPPPPSPSLPFASLVRH